METIKGINFVDDRGMLTFFNDFDMSEVKRVYQVRNHKAGFIRAWHGHRKEGKYVQVVQGAAQIGIVPMLDEESEDMGITSDYPDDCILSEHDPKILYIPPGYYNGFKTLTDNCIIQFFGTTTLEESLGDDYRKAWDHWFDWEEEDYR